MRDAICASVFAAENDKYPLSISMYVHHYIFLFECANLYG